jgi:hypothetical protein
MSYFVKKKLIFGLWAGALIANCPAGMLPNLMDDALEAEGSVLLLPAEVEIGAEVGAEIVDEIGAEIDTAINVDVLEEAKVPHLLDGEEALADVVAAPPPGDETPEQDLQQAIESLQQIIYIVPDEEGFAILMDEIKQTIWDIFEGFSAQQRELLYELEMLWNALAAPSPSAASCWAPRAYGNPWGSRCNDSCVNSYIGRRLPWGYY